MEGAEETKTDLKPKKSVRRNAYMQVSVSITKFVMLHVGLRV